MPLNFPNNPQIGDQYTSDSGVIYVFDGDKWTGHPAEQAPIGTISYLINGGKTAQIEANGNFRLPTYTLPTTSGTYQQTLVWPSSGNVLEWANEHAFSWELSSGTAIISLAAEDPSNYFGSYGELRLNSGTYITFRGDGVNTDNFFAVGMLSAGVENNTTSSFLYTDGVPFNVTVNSTATYSWVFNTDGALVLPSKLTGLETSNLILEANQVPPQYTVSNIRFPDIVSNNHTIWFNASEDPNIVTLSSYGTLTNWTVTVSDGNTTTITDGNNPDGFFSFITAVPLTGSGTLTFRSPTTPTNGVELASNGHSLVFGPDGKLKLPVNGDIVDSDGVTVLGRVTLEERYFDYNYRNSLYGISGLTAVTQIGDDDSEYEIPLPFAVTFLGQQYSSVWLSSNSYISFLSVTDNSLAGYPLYWPQGPKLLGVPAVLVGASDRNITNYYYGATGDGRFVIRYEGIVPNSSGDMTQPQSRIWEAWFYDSDPGKITIVVSSNMPTGGVWGLHDGKKWIDVYEELPRSDQNSDGGSFDSVDIFYKTPQPIDTFKFIGQGVETYITGTEAFIEINPLQGIVNVNLDGDGNTVLTSAGYGLTLRSNHTDDINIESNSDVNISAHTPTSDYPGQGRNVYINAGNGGSSINQQNQSGGNVYINAGQGTGTSNGGSLYVTTHKDNGGGQYGWEFRQDGNLTIPQSPGYQVPAYITPTVHSTVEYTSTGTVVFTSLPNQMTAKLLIQVESLGDGRSSGNWDTQSCEMIISRSWRDDKVIASVYGVTHSSVMPLALFDAQLNNSAIEVVCIPTASAFGTMHVVVVGTTIATSD